MNTNINSTIISQTCQLLVAHIRNLLEAGYNSNSRLFSHMLHPEKDFVFAGKSIAVTAETPTHPEHVVPCAFMIKEIQRMIKDGAQDEQIASLLNKHWKVATITKEEQQRLDFKLGYKSTMPPEWRFEDGDTFKRFELADITIVS